MHIAPLRKQTGALLSKQGLLCLGLLQILIWMGVASPCKAQHPLLPDTSKMPGWRMAGEIYHYGPRDLYEYIDGEADFFVAYGFVALVGAVYEVESDPGQFMTADLYDMGGKLSAFGVYQAKRDRSLPTLGMGAASAGAEGYASFYKGRYYVEILSVVREEKWRRHHVALAASIADNIEGDSSPPRELSWFPEKGRVDGSERYVVGGVLGHSFLPRGLVCRYGEEDNGVWAYVAFFETSEDAARSHGQHKAFLQESGQTLSPVTIRDALGFLSREPFHGQIVEVREGSWIIGAYGLEDAENGQQLILEMLKRIPPARRE